MASEIGGARERVENAGYFSGIAKGDLDNHSMTEDWHNKMLDEVQRHK